MTDATLQAFGLWTEVCTDGVCVLGKQMSSGRSVSTIWQDMLINQRLGRERQTLCLLNCSLCHNGTSSPVPCIADGSWAGCHGAQQLHPRPGDPLGALNSQGPLGKPAGSRAQSQKR